MRVRMYVVARVEGCNYILYTNLINGNGEM